MANRTKKGFKTIETDYEELDKKIRGHRRRLFTRSVRLILLVLALFIGIELVYALKSFDSYEIKSTIDRSSSTVTQFEDFNGHILEYSSDGITCVGLNRELLWNQSYEMSSPKVEMCGEYLAVYDAGGTQIYILTESGLQQQIETASPIQTLCVAEQGTVAVLMKEKEVSQVKLFDRKGNELANGKFYGDKGGFPIDIALSYDATKLAVDMVDISKGVVSTTISFYNFGTVGQSEIDNNVGVYTFDGVLIPDISYVSATKMIAMGTGKILLL